MIRINAPYENKRSKSLLKRKDFMDEEFIILDILEGSGKLANKAGMVVFNTNEGVRVESAINGNHEYLEEIWLDKDNIIGKKATVKYFNKTEAKEKAHAEVGVAIHPSLFLTMGGEGGGG